MVQNRIPTAGTFFSTTWMTHRDLGKEAYGKRDFNAALSSFTAALHPSLACPSSKERQILLSNIVACRLQLGGAAQVEAAIETAKKCVAVDERWAKGHVRLASAYIALGDGRHSNDACNALQRALQLNSGNTAARSMLVQELRNRDSRPASQSASCSSSSCPMASAPPAEEDDQEYAPTNPTSDQSNTASNTPAVTPSSSSRPFQGAPHYDLDEGDYENGDGSMQESWSEALETQWNRTKSWYQSQSEDRKGILKVMVVLLLLYVVLGGRLGFENARSMGSRRRGNYDTGNAYDEFRNKRRQREASSSRRHRDNQYDHARYRDDEYSHNRYEERYETGSSNRRRTSGSPFGNLFDGNLKTVALLGGALYMAHRNGIRPMQALFFLNMLNGGRRNRAGRVHVGGGGGFWPGGYRRRRW